MSKQLQLDEQSLVTLLLSAISSYATGRIWDFHLKKYAPSGTSKEILR